MMKFKTFSVTMVLVLLLAACTAPAAPVPTGIATQDNSYPAVESPPAYPVPDPQITSYPAPDDTREPSISPMPGQADEPWQPQPGDAQLQRGEVFLDEVQVLTRESMPPQYVVQVRGSLPTPCNQLRAEVEPPDAAGNIAITLYSVISTEMMCTQVLAPFDATITLRDLPSGQYTVLVNEQPSGDLSVP